MLEEVLGFILNNVTVEVIDGETGEVLYLDTCIRVRDSLASDGKDYMVQSVTTDGAMTITFIVIE